MKKLVVFTGAGISAESGIKTFRDTDGLWEEYDINEVATPHGWEKNPELVLHFYNLRRQQVLNAQPNQAHFQLAELEKRYDVHIITQNIDNLHERAGSTKVLHLHGEIMKAQSTLDATLVYDLREKGILLGDKCKKGSQLRPHIVWFGEMVPNMEIAHDIASNADIFIVVGTSLNVYPAAGLVDFTPFKIPKYLVDPGEFNATAVKNLVHIKEMATTGLAQLAKELM